MSLGYTLRVIPAIIAETPKELDEKLRRVLGFSKMVMLDVMDGVFVESRSINFTSDLPSGILYQSHLMVKDPLHYAETIRGKVDTAIIHIESISGIKEIEQIKKMDFNVFLALNPGTPASCVIPHLSLIDGVLIMTVEPGRYGAPFNFSTTKFRTWATLSKVVFLLDAKCIFLFSKSIKLLFLVLKRFAV